MQRDMPSSLRVKKKIKMLNRDNTVPYYYVRCRCCSCSCCCPCFHSSSSSRSSNEREREEEGEEICVCGARQYATATAMFNIIHLFVYSRHFIQPNLTIRRADSVAPSWTCFTVQLGCQTRVSHHLIVLLLKYNDEIGAGRPTKNQRLAWLLSFSQQHRRSITVS